MEIGGDKKRAFFVPEEEMKELNNAAIEFDAVNYYYEHVGAIFANVGYGFIIFGDYVEIMASTNAWGRKINIAYRSLTSELDDEPKENLPDDVNYCIDQILHFLKNKYMTFLETDKRVRLHYVTGTNISVYVHFKNTYKD